MCKKVALSLPVDDIVFAVLGIGALCNFLINMRLFLLGFEC